MSEKAVLQPPGPPPPCVALRREYFPRPRFLLAPHIRRLAANARARSLMHELQTPSGTCISLGLCRISGQISEKLHLPKTIPQSDQAEQGSPPSCGQGQKPRPARLDAAGIQGWHNGRRPILERNGPDSSLFAKPAGKHPSGPHGSIVGESKFRARVQNPCNGTANWAMLRAFCIRDRHRSKTRDACRPYPKRHVKSKPTPSRVDASPRNGALRETESFRPWQPEGMRQRSIAWICFAPNQ